MTWNEREKQVIRDAAAAKVKRFRASVKLGVVVRTEQRKVTAFRQLGEACFEHGNKGKTPTNKANFEGIMEFITTH